jgi:Rrf2 family protein
MFLTKTTEYAIRVLIFMATHDDDIFTTLSLSKKLKIPYKYLSKIMTDLARAGLVVSIKGRSGGFKIAKPLSQISLYDIVSSVEGTETLNSCILGFPDCSAENPCALHYIWEQNKEAIIKTMKQTTLEYFRKIRNKIKRY